jgi:hypothetical protein
LSTKTAEVELHECGLAPDAVQSFWQEHGFGNTKLFQVEVFDVFMPDTIGQREKLGYGGRILRIFDGFTGHTIDMIEESFIYHERCAIIIPPQISRRFGLTISLRVFPIRNQNLWLLRGD